MLFVNLFEAKIYGYRLYCTLSYPLARTARSAIFELFKQIWKTPYSMQLTVGMLSNISQITSLERSRFVFIRLLSHDFFESWSGYESRGAHIKRHQCQEKSVL